MNQQRDNDLLEFATSFDLMVCQMTKQEAHRALSMHIQWLDETHLPETSGHALETLMLWEQWRLTHHWLYRISDSGQIPGYKSLEHHIAQVMNPVTLARWNDGYHAELSWSVTLPTGNVLGGEIAVEHEAKENANGL